MKGTTAKQKKIISKLSGFILSYLPRLEIATHWSPMQPKIEHWRLNFQNWSPAGLLFISGIHISQLIKFLCTRAYGGGTGFLIPVFRLPFSLKLAASKLTTQTSVLLYLI